MSEQRYIQWRVRPQEGIRDGKPVPGAAQVIDSIPLTLAEVRERWEPRRGNPGLFNGKRPATIRPLAPAPEEVSHG